MNPHAAADHGARTAHPRAGAELLEPPPLGEGSAALAAHNSSTSSCPAPSSSLNSLVPSASSVCPGLLLQTSLPSLSPPQTPPCSPWAASPFSWLLPGAEFPSGEGSHRLHTPPLPPQPHRSGPGAAGLVAGAGSLPGPWHCYKEILSLCTESSGFGKTIFASLLKKNVETIPPILGVLKQFGLRPTLQNAGVLLFYLSFPI